MNYVNNSVFKVDNNWVNFKNKLSYELEQKMLGKIPEFQFKIFNNFYLQLKFYYI